MRRIFLLGLLALLAMGVAQNVRAQRPGGVQIRMGGGGVPFNPAQARAPQAFPPGQIRPAYRRFDRDHDGDRGRFHGGRHRWMGYGYLPYGAGYGYVANDLGYDYATYDSGYAYPAGYAGGPYGAAPTQPVIVVQPPPVTVQAPAPAVAKAPEHAVIQEYSWPTKGKASLKAASAQADATSQPGGPETDFGIVLKDGSVLTAETVFASEDGLHYVDPDGRHMLVAVSAVDRAATLKLNRERNLSLYLPAPE
ncbi:MAG TPA: hypothetical protein VFU68_06040 [Terracidiphilus sp.]|nr:hypothetical protein [Terracidiphilus sp.]